MEQVECRRQQDTSHLGLMVPMCSQRESSKHKQTMHCTACRPPFEVEDEAQTAALIMYSDAIKFPPNRTQQRCEFVKSALIKSPELRPSAAVLLKHPW